MSVNSLNLTIDVSVIAPCTGLKLIDSTGVYNEDTNPFGYGFPNGLAINDVTELEIVVTYNSLGTTATYLFTVASGEITDATLALGSATPVNIFSALEDTTFPFTSSNAFNLTGDYGVTLPEFADEVFKVEYTISGENEDEEVFDLTALAYIPVGCNARCCIDKKWADIDLNCSCSHKSYTDVLYLESLYNQFNYATDAGSLAKALNALREIQKICGSDCGCGC